MTSRAGENSSLQYKLFIRRRASATQDTPPGHDDLKWVANTTTLVYGEREALLVDTFLSDEQTAELADWILASERRLSTIYITHGHPDHFFGLNVLRDRFPEARALAMPQVVNVMQAAVRPESVENWRRSFPGLIPESLAVAERLDQPAFKLEGNEIIPVDIGHTDTDHTTCLHVPSIALVIAGDAIYNGTHPYLVESDHEGMLAWLAAIDKIEALKPRAVVVGHGPLDPDNAPRHIGETRRYIQDFMRLDAETTTARELYDRMLALYPDRINPGSLWGSAHAAKSRVAKKKAQRDIVDVNWGSFVIGRKTIKRRMRARLLAIKTELRRTMHDPIAKIGIWIKRMLQGHLNYFAVSGNHPSSRPYGDTAMTHRRGESNRNDLKRSWPHHVALPAEKLRSHVNREVIFCAAGVLSATPLTYSLRHNDSDYVVFCFSKPEDAEAFAKRFDGERLPTGGRR